MVAVIPLIGMIASVYIYAVYLYPVIPAAFGGGRPELITLWIKKEAVPDKLLEGLSSDKCRSDGATAVHCESLYLLYRDGSHMVLGDRAAPGTKGLIVKREDVLAVAWPTKAEHGVADGDGWTTGATKQ
jgi:hypothetical protein